jgi:hypothetical protein
VSGGRLRFERLLVAALIVAALPPQTAHAAAEPAHAPSGSSAASAHAPSRAVTFAQSSSRADSAPTVHAPIASSRVGSKSQTGPPLTSSTTPRAGDETAASAEGSVGEADPLVSNGLGSPSCRGALGAGELPSGAREDCETSGFVAAAAPTGDFGVDVHIDTGLLGLSSGGLLASVQDLCVTPLWMALVWAVHALVVMLEWCFAIDLLDSPSVQLGIARGLRAAQAAFTVPWLAAVLALGALALAYDGLVRRRVGESLARALLALTMTAGGFWLMLDPAGTVGALGGWANQASLGTLAVSARGSPSEPGAALDAAMGTVFAAVVEGPWCYLEFGDVGWCRNPRRLDPQLRAAALALATEELARVGCSFTAASAGECVARDSADARALANSARLLRSARTNGAIFLALPANGVGRNSINDSRSLLRAICRSEEATRCRGPSASEAEFRTNHGTWPRVGGLLLIGVGALGMLLLLGHIALRLLTAALFSLLYLLLAPLVTLAPALGESGRAVFRKWGAQLLAAVVSKLLFSFALGAVLGVLGILASLEALGWWTQWLLMSAFWWAAFMHRHQAFELASGRGEPHRAGWRRASLPRVSTVGARRRIVERARAAKARLERQTSSSRARDLARARSLRDRTSWATAREPPDVRPTRVDRQTQRVVEAEARDVDAHGEDAGAIAARVAAFDARLERVRRERVVASAAQDRRRSLRLAWRGERIEAEAGAARSELDRAHRAAAGREPTARPSTRTDDRRDRARFLDRQSVLPAALEAHRGRAAVRRDYVALAGLAGHGAREYEQLAPREQRVARLAIDRELAIRRERLLTTAGATSTVETATGGRPVTPIPWREPDPLRPARRGASESTVMQDARAVAERRKRQLGTGRP